MSVMMKEDSSYLNNAVVSKSKKSLFKELTWMVLQSSNYIKTLPEVDLNQLDAKKVLLQNKAFGNPSEWVNHKRKFFASYSVNPMHIGIKTIIFDMDETLIHKIDASDKCQQADIYVEIPTEDNSKTVNVSIW